MARNCSPIPAPMRSDAGRSHTTRAVEKAEEYLHQQEGVEHVNALVG